MGKLFLWTFPPGSVGAQLALRDFLDPTLGLEGNAAVFPPADGGLMYSECGSSTHLSPAAESDDLVVCHSDREYARKNITCQAPTVTRFPDNAGMTQGTQRGGRKQVPPAGSKGRRIYDLRIAAGLSQIDLAKVMGVHQTIVSKLENNMTNDCFSEAMAKLADRCNTTIEYIHTGKVKGARGAPELDVLNIYRAVPDTLKPEWLEQGRRYGRLALGQHDRKKEKDKHNA